MTASHSCYYQANRPTCYMLVNIISCICVEFVFNLYVFFLYGTSFDGHLPFLVACFWQMNTVCVVVVVVCPPHRLRIRILWIFLFLKIHKFSRILKMAMNFKNKICYCEKNYRWDRNLWCEVANIPTLLFIEEKSIVMWATPTMAC